MRLRNAAVAAAVGVAAVIGVPAVASGAAAATPGSACHIFATAGDFPVAINGTVGSGGDLCVPNAPLIGPLAPFVNAGVPCDTSFTIPGLSVVTVVCEN